MGVYAKVAHSAWMAGNAVAWFAVEALRAVIRTLPALLLLGGAAAVVYGISLVHGPAAWIAGGALALGAGWRMAR